MQPLELIQAAVSAAPGDADRLLAWVINSVPPARRQSVYDRIVDTMSSARLTGELVGPLTSPRLFTADAAQQTWEDLVAHLASEDEEREVEPFFRPDGVHFVPQAYPSRWAPAHWNASLSPAEVRASLQATDSTVKELVKIAETFVARKKSGEDARVAHLARYPRSPLAVGVLPYADALPMVTLLYAVSDIVEGITFGPASFYNQQGASKQSVWIESAAYNAGYATRYQLEGLKRKTGAAVTGHEVFSEGFTRSLFLRMDLGRALQIPQLTHLSFVGQFGPDEEIRELDKDLTDPAVAEISRMMFIENFRISEHLDPMTNWEIPLILSFASGLNGNRDIKAHGLALTVSTDAHLWAASFGLNLEADAPEPDAPLLAQPTFRRAAWNPTHQARATLEDQHAQLCWFVPSVNDRLRNSLQELIVRLVTGPVRDALQALEDNPVPESLPKARAALAPLARCLLAPLLTAFPNYRGPMLAAPPEAWLAKLRGPAHYVGYRPPWHIRLKGRQAETATPSQALLDFQQIVA